MNHSQIRLNGIMFPRGGFSQKVETASFDDLFLKKRGSFVRMVIVRDSHLNKKSPGKSPERSSEEHPKKSSGRTIQVSNDMGRRARYQCPRTMPFPESGETFDYRVHLANCTRGRMEENL
jgi:hypothetical protein